MKDSNKPPGKTIHLSEDVYDRLTEAARATRFSRQGLVQHVVAAGLDLLDAGELKLTPPRGDR